MQRTAFFSKQQQPLQFLEVPVHEGYIVIHEGYLLVHEGYIWFMRVIFWFMGVICFPYSMLTTSFPRERDVVKVVIGFSMNLGKYMFASLIV